VLKNFYRLKRKEDGQSVVEFALVLPILLMVVLGIMEFGWLFYGNIVMTSSAREGARTAAILAGDGKIDDNDKDAIGNIVANHLSSTSITLVTNYPLVSASLNGTPKNLSDIPDGSEVKVTVKGNMTPLVGFFVSNPAVLQKDATMRRE
jgi:Flp pilus assembly protein TadG